jgi:uncharacterized membrane protein YtjA (UPF0391 family)
MGLPRPVLQSLCGGLHGPVRDGFVPAEARFSPFHPQEPLLSRSIGQPVMRARSGAARFEQAEVRIMLGWVVTFLLIALIAGVLGFGGVAGASIEIAKIIFVIALILFLISAIFGIVRSRRI